LNPSVAQNRAPVDFTFVHQDPAGDVLKFNATINGTPTDDTLYEALDIKWIYSNKDGLGNILLEMDLKAKNKFINEDETKYVFRILTTSDNSTGYNITYKNETAILMPFTPAGNGTPVNIMGNVSFKRDRGDEIMQITISISKYLSDISYFGVDAYSLKIIENATYLDYISELPGHPEYVNPEVEEGENIDSGEGGDDGKTEESGAPMILWIAILIIIIVVILLVVLMWNAKKYRQNR
jgi:hypothetical protein